MNLSTSRSQKLAEKYEIFPNAIILHIVSREETKCYEIKFSDKITSYFDLIHFDDERKCIQCVNVKFLKIQGNNLEVSLNFSIFQISSFKRIY